MDGAPLPAPVIARRRLREERFRGKRIGVVEGADGLMLGRIGGHGGG
jgi:hypothetical protein